MENAFPMIQNMVGVCESVGFISIVYVHKLLPIALHFIYEELCHGGRNIHIPIRMNV